MPASAGDAARGKRRRMPAGGRGRRGRQRQPPGITASPQLGSPGDGQHRPAQCCRSQRQDRARSFWAARLGSGAVAATRILPAAGHGMATRIWCGSSAFRSRSSVLAAVIGWFCSGD